jgi:poly-gamma-glutamate synthesis protein (capsule biosynthesis protein)
MDRAFHRFAMTRWLFVWLFIAMPAQAQKLVFTGDVMLGRGVAAEMQSTGASPFAALALLGAPDVMMGNFEGAVGDPSDCPVDPHRYCLAMPPALVKALKSSPFTAFSLANNHGADLGPAGRARTEAVLRQLGIIPAPPAETPIFLRAGPYSVAVVALDMVPGRDGVTDQIPSDDVAQKLRLARALGDIVVVFIHWGGEFRDWPLPDQQREAGWLTGQGVDLIIGAHPHVPITPDCIHGVPVFWSLGNFLFDQPMPETRVGMLAMCDISGGTLRCHARGSQAAAGSTFPTLAGPLPSPADACERVLRPGLTVAGWRIRGFTRPDGTLDLEGTKPGQRPWHNQGPTSLLEAEAGKFELGQPQQLVLLQRVYSRLDGANDPRPYIYEIQDYGLQAIWRGTALGWPLRDVIVVQGKPDLLCALHRDETFLVMNSIAPATRIEAWRWTGFGFSLAPAQRAQCAGLW